MNYGTGCLYKQFLNQSEFRKYLFSDSLTVLEGVKEFVPVLSTFRGSTVVKVLCYKSEVRWFDS